MGSGPGQTCCWTCDLVSSPADDFFLAFGLSPQWGLPSAFRPSHLPGEFSSWSGGPQQVQELSWLVEPREGPPTPPRPASCLLLFCSWPGGSKEPRGLGDCPLPFPGLGLGPPPMPLPELWVKKPALREWPCLLSGKRASSPRPLSGRLRHPHISKVQRLGAPPGGRGFISPWLPSFHPPLSTLLLPPSGSRL